MASPHDDQNLGLLAAFVHELYKLGGWPSWAAFARAAKFPAPNLSNVQLGKAGIEGPNLVALIRATAERANAAQTDVATSAVLAIGPSGPVDRLLGVEAAVARLAARMDEGLEKLDDRVGALESQPASRAGRSQTTSRRGRKPA